MRYLQRRPRFRPAAVFIREMILACEAQQWIAILRKWRRALTEFGHYARIIEHRIPYEVRKKHFHQCGKAADFSRTSRERVHDFGRRPLQPRRINGTALSLRFRERVGQLHERLRTRS